MESQYPDAMVEVEGMATEDFRKGQRRAGRAGKDLFRCGRERDSALPPERYPGEKGTTSLFLKARPQKDLGPKPWPLTYTVMILFSLPSGLPVSKPYVISQMEEGKEPYVLEGEISTDWEKRPKAKESILNQGISKEELLQIASVEKHVRDELCFCKLKVTYGCDDQLEIHPKNQERHLKEMSITHRSTTLKIDHERSEFGRNLGLRSVLTLSVLVCTSHFLLPTVRSPISCQP
ncbi:hypothetical protein GH733_009070 [Mirounga leonina]|nr:hypothetical protein GH733_009070 [Mirounga leonina]